MMIICSIIISGKRNQICVLCIYTIYDEILCKLKTNLYLTCEHDLFEGSMRQKILKTQTDFMS